MPTLPKDLLHQVAELQSSIEGFSFENLSVDQARRLKREFESFRRQLEQDIWHPVESGQHAIQPPREDTTMLIATVSHEVRTPLNGIIGFTDLLRESSLAPKELEYVEAIRSASRSMLDIINELLEFTKLSAGTESAVQAPFSPKQVFRETTYLCRTLIVNKEVSLESYLDPELPPLLIGDPSKLSQILLNLLGNAIKFVDSGKIRLGVRSEVNEGYCTLFGEISDTGPGINPDDLDRIFEAFEQAGPPSQPAGQGTGLGLSIVRKLVEQQGGAVWAESKPGAGSSFRFRLTYPVGKPGSKAVKRTNHNNTSLLEGCRVLVFEDNPLNRQLIETRLKSWGCKARCVERFGPGFALLRQQHFDLILMDLHLPDIDGYQASLYIRGHENPAIRKLPILAVTADFTAEDMDRMSAAGINDLVLKPYTPDELKGKLIGCLKSGTRGESHPDKNSVAGNTGQCVGGLGQLLEDCLGDIRMLEELVNLFRSNILEFLGAVKIHLKSPDYDMLAGAAHKIKPGLRMLGLAAWLALVEEIYTLSRNRGSLEQISNLHQELISGHADMEEALNRQLQTLKNL